MSNNPFLLDDNTVVDYQIMDEGSSFGQEIFGNMSDAGEDFYSFPGSPEARNSPVQNLFTIENENTSQIGGAMSNPPSGNQTTSDIDGRISRILEAVEKVVVIKNESEDGKVDLRHIENFSGDGDSSTVALNLKVFIQELVFAFKGKTLNDHQKILLAKQKLTKTARSTVNSKDHITFPEFIEFLNENFGGADEPHDNLLDLLKHYTILPNQNFTQFACKAKDIATLISVRLQCEVTSKIVFDALAKGLLSNFKDHISTQSEVKVALKDRDPDKLISTLKELTKTDPKCLITPGAHNLNKIGQAKGCRPKQKTDINAHKDDKSDKNSVQNCQLCNTNGHLAPSCPTLKQYSHKNQNPFLSQNYRGPTSNFNPFRNGNYYSPQQYQGRTPRFYQPRGYYRPRYRNYAPSRQPHCPSPYSPAQTGRPFSNDRVDNSNNYSSSNQSDTQQTANDNNEQVFS